MVHLIGLTRCVAFLCVCDGGAGNRTLVRAARHCWVFAPVKPIRPLLFFLSFSSFKLCYDRYGFFSFDSSSVSLRQLDETFLEPLVRPVLEACRLLIIIRMHLSASF